MAKKKETEINIAGMGTEGAKGVKEGGFTSDPWEAGSNQL